MKFIKARNINSVYPEGLWWLHVLGEQEESRNGKVLVAPGPVMTCYHTPTERVLLDEKRDANPFFHLAEAIWMLAGANDVDWITQFNHQMAAYSDDGARFNGAYGYRWRYHFGFDQLREVMARLRADRSTRQAVLTMWDPTADLGAATKDKPCNTQVYFRVKGGDTLESTVMCRSNDIIWGAYGANAVHFSMLHEFIARGSGLKVGRMYQLSNNFHIYEHHWPLLHNIDTPEINPYDTIPGMNVLPLMETGDGKEVNDFLIDCAVMEVGGQPTRSPFLVKVAQPMLNFYLQRKGGGTSVGQLPAMPECDWSVAARRWLERRAKPKEK